MNFGPWVERNYSGPQSHDLSLELKREISIVLHEFMDVYNLILDDRLEAPRSFTRNVLEDQSIVSRDDFESFLLAGIDMAQIPHSHDAVRPFY